MTITVNGPNGITINFPDGTDSDTINRVMREAMGQAPTAQKPQQPEMSLGEVGADVAKSAGIGLVQGGIGLATLPGNLEALGRAGINAGAGLVGAQPPVSSETFLPTYSDWKGAIEQRTGEFYKPKSVAGEYARTIGEFAPLALGGGASAAARAARVAIPATVSETAGQLTKGTAAEPYARAAGAIVGGFAPNVAARLVTPAPANQARQAAVQTLENEGVTALTAGQRTGNERIRWLEDATSMVPGGGGRATALQQQANEQFTRAALARAGVQADRATPDVIDNAFRQIGQEYQNFAAATNIPGSRLFANRFASIARDYQGITNDATRIPVVTNLAADLGQNLTRGITGRQYNAYRSDLQRLQRELKNNPQAANAVGRMTEQLDLAMLRSAPVAQRQQLRAALQDRNRRYRNLLAIEDASAAAGEAAASGIITPNALKNAIKKNDKKGYTRNRNDMAPLARSGVEAITPLRSSGTAERTFAQGVVGAPSTAWGAATGAIAGGGDPLMTLAGAAAPHVIKAMTARSLMSRPGQAWLGNQAIPQAVEPVNWLTISPFAAAQAEPALRGGIGPRYDEYGNRR